MANNFYRDLTKILRENDCDFDRQGQGSHEIWRCRTNGRKFTVPTKIKSRHTANEALKQAGLEKVF